MLHMYARLNTCIYSFIGNCCPIVPQPKNETDMKILKPGKTTPPQMIFNCQKCGCRFLADDNDKHLDPRDGDFVKCPTCGHTIGWALGDPQKPNQ